jgi:hypothetical protein
MPLTGNFGVHSFKGPNLPIGCVVLLREAALIVLTDTAQISERELVLDEVGGLDSEAFPCFE